MWGKRIVAVMLIGWMVVSYVGAALGQMQTQSHKARVGISNGGGGGGPMLTAVLFDLSELEKSLLPKSPEFAGDLILDKNKVSLLWGGGGFGGSGRLRFGGQGWGGEWTVAYPSENKAFNQAKLSIEGGGFMMDYLLVSGNRLSLSLGAVIGGTGITLVLDNKFATSSWSEIVKGPKSLELSRSYFMVESYLAFQLKFASFMGIRVTAGYLFQTSFDDWQLQDETKIKNGPLKTLTAPVVNVMLFFGK